MKSPSAATNVSVLCLYLYGSRNVTLASGAPRPGSWMISYKMSQPRATLHKFYQHVHFSLILFYLQRTSFTHLVLFNIAGLLKLNYWSMGICIMKLGGLARLHCCGNTRILVTAASNGCTLHSAASVAAKKVTLCKRAFSATHVKL